MLEMGCEHDDRRSQKGYGILDGAHRAAALSSEVSELDAYDLTCAYDMSFAVQHVLASKLIGRPRTPL